MMRGLPYALLLLCVASLISLLWRRSKVALFAAVGSFAAFALLVWFCAPSSILASPFTSSAIEALFLMLCLATLTRSPSLTLKQNSAEKFIIVWCVYEVIASTALTGPVNPGRIAALSHPLAGFHIVLAMAAKSLALAGCLAHLLNNDKPSRLVRAALWAQGTAIVLGMLWAQDAWLSLWQWDPIETLALLVWIALLFAWQSRQPLWSALTLALLVTSELMANGSFGAGSQHSYSEPEYLTAALHAAWLVSAVWLGKNHIIKSCDYISTTCAFVLLFVGLMTAFGFVFNNTVLSFVCSGIIIIFSVSRVYLHRKLYRLSDELCLRGMCPPERLSPSKKAPLLRSDRHASFGRAENAPSDSALHSLICRLFLRRYAATPSGLRRQNVIEQNNVIGQYGCNYQDELLYNEVHLVKRRCLVNFCFAGLLLSLLCIKTSSDDYNITPLVRRTPCGEAMMTRLSNEFAEITVSNKKYTFTNSPIQEQNYCYASLKVYKLSAQYSDQTGLMLRFTDVSRSIYWLMVLLVLVIASYCSLNPPPRSKKDK